LSEATAIQFTAPLFMTALSALVLKESVGWHRWTAVAVGFAGILVMVHPQAGHLDGIGVALALSAAVFVAAAMVAVRQLTASEHPAAVVFYFTLTGTIVGLIGSIGNWAMPDLSTLAALVAAGIIGGVTQILLTESLRLAALGVVAPFDYSQLLWAALLGYAFWGEFPDAYTILGAAIVATSGLYILHRELRRLRAMPR
jgi:drug/metabolite transporter (DMT)-like permease